MKQEHLVWNEAYAVYLEDQWENGNLRHRILLQTAADFIPPSTGSILDMGCGFGDLWPLLQKKGYMPPQYLGMDVSLAMLQRARKKYPEVGFVKGNVTNMADLGHFDYVVACSLLVHLEDITGAIQEMWKHTRRGLIASFTDHVTDSTYIRRGLMKELVHQIPVQEVRDTIATLPNYKASQWHRIGDLVLFFLAFKDLEDETNGI